MLVHFERWAWLRSEAGCHWIPSAWYEGTPFQRYPMSSSHHTPPVILPCLYLDVWRLREGGTERESPEWHQAKEVFSWENLRDTQGLHSVQCLLKVWLFSCSTDSNGFWLDQGPEQGVGTQNQGNTQNHEAKPPMSCLALTFCCVTLSSW